MLSELDPSQHGVELTDAERGRIRAEVRYALIAAKEARQSEPSKSGLSLLLSYLSNGFVLLVLGTVLTSILVPSIQRKSDLRKQQYTLAQECLTQFLLYSNSLWQEYYATLPLTQELEIDKSTYLQQLKTIADLKLKRYDAYAKTMALSAALRSSSDIKASSNIDSSVQQYAIQLNAASSAIDEWLTGMYCTPVRRNHSPCATFDPAFDAYEGHLKIKALVVAIGNESTEKVAGEIVNQMNAY